MNNIRAFVGAFLLLGGGVALFAEESSPRTPEAVTPETISPEVKSAVSALLQRLASEDFSTRETATRSIATLPPEAYELLAKAAADPATDSEVRDRISRALPALRVKYFELQRRRRDAAGRAWQLKQALNAYDTIGQRDPKWDDEVHTGLGIYAETPGTKSRTEIAREACLHFRKALDAGCHDPMALHRYAAALSYLPECDIAEVRRSVAEAGLKYPRSAYPPSFKLSCCIMALRLVKEPGLSPEDVRVRMTRWFDLAMAEWPATVAMDGIPDNDLIEAGAFLFDQAKTLEFHLDRVHQLIIGPMGQRQGSHLAMLVLDGNACMVQAWDARGYNAAAEVPEAWMRRSLQFVAAARKSYEDAWKLDPTSPYAPTEMIQVELLQSTGRASMERWFQRAMEANPDNMQACEHKMNYLQPRWYGSYEEMVQFGRECLAGKNWAARLPVMLATAHETIASQTGEHDAYMSRPEVWADLRAVYEGLLKYDPKRDYDRSYYVLAATRAGQWSVADAQCKILGDKPNLVIFGSQENYERVRQQIAKHLRPGASTTRPAPR